MDARVWQRYVAVACGHAWQLDVHDTEEVLRCIEALLAAPISGATTVRILLRTGVGELVAEPKGAELHIRIRTQTRAADDTFGHGHLALPSPEPARPLDGLLSTWGGETMNRSWKSYVASLCSDAWGMTGRRRDTVIEQLEMLITTDQLTDVTVAGVLSSVGLADPSVGEAARSIRATIGDTRRTA